MHPPNIRPSVHADASSIEAVLRAAFPTDLEARLVDFLFERDQAAVSLVAEVEGRIVGHILFSPATAHRSPHAPREEFVSRSETTTVTGLGLAPLAVLPEFQRCGIGAALVRAGLAECRRRQAPWVIVLGDPAYYSRFGFLPASRWQLTSEFGGGEAFQFLPLTGNAKVIEGGLVCYAAAFRELLAGS